MLLEWAPIGKDRGMPVSYLHGRLAVVVAVTASELFGTYLQSEPRERTPP